MKLRRWRTHHQHEAAELNITAFMNLMVILVPFLLITAVFSRLAILELSLPAPSETAEDTDKPKLQLEIVIRDGGLEVADTESGLLKSFPIDKEHTSYNLAGLNSYLQRVKSEFPDITSATILLEPDIAYDALVQVMDSVRQFTQEGENAVKAELFPDISIGDAVLLADIKGDQE